MHIWIGGYWGWENDAHVWIGGEWAEPPQPGYAWEAPRWRRHGHRWAYSPVLGHHGGPVYAPPVVSDPAYGGGVTISGRVMSMQGTPVPGIVVTLAGTQEGQIVTDGQRRLCIQQPATRLIRRATDGRRVRLRTGTWRT